MTPNCIQNQLQAGMLISTCLKTLPPSHCQFGPLGPIDPTCRPQQSLSQNTHLIVGIQLVVKDNKFPKKMTELFDLLQSILIFSLPVFVQLEKSQIIKTPNIKHKSQFLSYSGLHFDEIFFVNFTMNYLFIDCLDFQWINFVHLGRNQHRYHPNYVKFGNGKFLLLNFKIPVHNVNCAKVGLGCEFVGRSHFYHPVKHPSSQSFINIMIKKEGTERR